MKTNKIKTAMYASMFCNIDHYLKYLIERKLKIKTFDIKIKATAFSLSGDWMWTQTSKKKTSSN